MILICIGQFVVNIISDWYLESANHTCGNFDPDVNEMDIAGLTPIPSVIVKPPRVGESAVQMECEVIVDKLVFTIYKTQFLLITLYYFIFFMSYRLLN